MATQHDPMENSVLRRILSAQRHQREYSDESVRLVRDHFNELAAYQYEHIIGRGVYGVAYSIIKKHRFSKRTKRFVVKRAQIERAKPELRHEINMMSRLNGSAHIARVIAAKDDENEQNEQRRPGIFRRMVARVMRRRKDILAGLPGPTLVLEHLENGTATDLMGVLSVRNRTLPNRVLWSFYLCLARACVAMKFPPEKPLGTKPTIEEIPEDQSTAGNIVHNDMHGGNVLIGALRDFPEHTTVPPLKLIDFGLSFVDAEKSEQLNILAASKQIYYLITRRYIVLEVQNKYYNGIITMATDILPSSNGDARFPTLDNDLRDLLARCLATDEADRPRLAEVLAICKNAVETKTPGSYGDNAPQETDYWIGRLLQEVIYDANQAP
ncbi:kinase-like domain-containing protein [Xylaria telfairii]|nr:kinase-like domain-containing protein [Xylaria telfairii]